MTESGFASDMGMEKFFDITCRIGDLRPSAVVLVATVKALKHHGGDIDGGAAEIETGAANLARHIGIIRRFGLNAVVGVNKFPTDTTEELELVQRLAVEQAPTQRSSTRRSRTAGRARPSSRRQSSPRPTSRTTSSSPTRTTRRSRRRSARSRPPSTARTTSFCSRPRRRRPRASSEKGSGSCRSAWRRRTSPSPTMPRS